MTNTEVSLDQLKGMNVGFLLAFLLGGCTSKKDDKKDDKKRIKKPELTLVCQSLSANQAPLVNILLNPTQTAQIIPVKSKEGDC